MKVFLRGLAGVTALALLGLFLFQMPGETQSAKGSANGSPLVAFALASGGPPPKAHAGFDQSVALGGTAVLDASGSSDPEGDELSFAWSFDSLPIGSLALISDPAAIKPSFQADEPGDYVARLTATDAFGKVASDTVIVSTGNLAPLADAGPDQTVEVGGLARLDASGSSDVNGDGLGFTWTFTGKPTGSTAALDDPTALQPSFTADLDGTYMLSLVADDGTLSSADDKVRISTFGSHPVAEAGPDQKVAVGQTVLVRLEGLFDVDGELIEERDWSIIARPPGSSADFLPNKNRRFIIDAPGSYLVQRMVCEMVGNGHGDEDDDGDDDDGDDYGNDDDDDGDDDDGDDAGNGGFCSDFDTVILTTDGNIRPVAQAGADQSVLPGDQVVLRGAGSSDLDGDLLTYRWALTTIPAGSLATLDDPAAVNPSFQADLAGSYVAQLIVKDGAEESRPDTVVVTTGNSRPVADAGPDQQKPKKNTITLDGSGSSDADNDALTYDWSLTKRPSASNATLNSPTSVNPTFYTDTGRRFVAQLIVRDGELASAPENVVVGPGNMRPVAEAGPDQEVLPGQLVNLDGAGSFDAANDPLVFQWALLSVPDGSTAALTGAGSATPSFTADLPGVYVAQLVVTDDDVAPLVSDPDTVVIAINNAPPIADAGPDQAVPTRTAVTLDGTGSSDPNSDPITFAWSFASTPIGSTAALTGADSAAPGFVADLAGDYVVQLIVNDGIVDSDPDLVTVTADANRPLAEAGPDQSVTEGALVILDGSASSDPEGRPLTYGWRFLFTPDDSTAAFSDAAVVGPSFTADLAGLYIAELTVSDGAFDSQPDTVALRAGSAVGNSPPTLEPIGPQTVALGGTLSFTLAGIDPNGDDLFFRAAPLPLPNGASLDATSGAFTFRPDAGQLGEVTLTFSVNDGLASDSESVVISVTGPPPGAVTAFSGRVLDANATALGQEIPVVGATVSFVSNPATATTDSTGAFNLSGVAAGRQILKVDGGTADAAPDGAAYAKFGETVELIAQADNQGDDPIFLPRIDSSSGTVYDPANPLATTVTNTALQATLEVESGSATLNGQAFSGVITLSELPPGSAAATLPPLVLPCQLITVQPFGLAFNPPAKLNLPNLDGLPALTQVDIWALNPATNRFSIVGTGQVTAGGTEIATISGGLPYATAVFAVPRAVSAVAAADENAFNWTPTALADGNLAAQYALPTYRSLGADRGLRFVYNSALASPTPVVAAEVTFPGNTGLPALVEGRLEVGGVEVAGPVFTSTGAALDPNDLGLGEGQTVRHALSFDASNLPTGSHPYRFVSTSDFGCSRVGTVSTGRVLVNNQSESPFGAGWTLAGLHSLTVQDDGRVLLDEGDGTTLVFDGTPEYSFQPPVGIPAAGPLAMAVDDLDADGNLDVAVPLGNVGAIALLFGDGTGAFPTVREIDAGVDITNGFPDTEYVVTGDFNGDGIRDLVVNNQVSDLIPDVNTNQIRVFLGTGGGFFGPPVLLAVEKPQGLGVADFNADGHDDIVVATSAGTIANSRTLVFFGDGTGGFQAPLTSSLGREQTSVEIADFNNDSLPDVAIPATKPSKLVVRLSDGAGDFSLSSFDAGTFAFSSGRYQLAAADFDLDGNMDIATTRRVYFGDGTGAFPLFNFLPRDIGGVLSISAADVDEDGLMDLVTSGASGDLGVLLNDGKRSFAISSVTPSGAAFLNSSRLGDFNKDGALDAVVSSLVANQVFVLLADPSRPSVFRSPGADFSELTRTAEGNFLRRMLDGTTFTFNPQGQLLQRADRNGNEISYTYDPQGRVTGISDPADPTRGTTLTYSGDKIANVAGPAGKTTFYEFDANGNPVEITRPDGSKRRYVYDDKHRLNSAVSPRGFVTTHDYNSAGQWSGTSFPDGASVSAQISKSLGLADLGIGLGTRDNPAPYGRPENQLVTFSDPENNITTIKLNEFGSPLEMTDTLGRIYTMNRGEDNRVTSFTVPTDAEATNPAFVTAGLADTLAATNTTAAVLAAQQQTVGTLTTELEYDDRGNITRKREATGTPLQRDTRFVYQAEFNRLTVIDGPGGLQQVFIYDAFGNPTETRRGVGSPDAGIPPPTRFFTYDARGRRLTAQDENGNLTRFFYNGLGNLERSIDGDLNETRHFYDLAGNLTKVVTGSNSPHERSFVSSYDELNRRTSRVNELGETVSFKYDASGNLIEIIDAERLVTSVSYDNLERAISVDYSPAGQRIFQRDLKGNVVSYTDALGNKWTYVYDFFDRLVRVVDPLLNDGVLTYDLQNNVKTVRDAGGNTTRFDYDVLGRTIRRENPLGQIWHYRYNLRDDLVEINDPKQQQVFARYQDDLSRLTEITTPDDELSFEYDSLGKLRFMLDGDSEIEFKYDGLNRLRSEETSPFGFGTQPNVTLTSKYDPLGNRLQLLEQTSTATNWSYDLAGRLANLETPAGASVDFSHRRNGQLAGIAFSNSVIAEFSYDLDGHLKHLNHSRGFDLILDQNYTHDRAGNIASIIGTGGNRDFDYDELQRLTGGGGILMPEVYGYDGTGNRLSSHLSANHTYDAANRLLEDDSYCYSYDANGNLETKIERVAGTCMGAVTTYRYDALDQLVRIDFSDGTFSAYYYDALGRRIGKDVNGTVTHYVYNGDNIVLEYNNSGVILARYSHTNRVDQPMVMERGGQVYFYHTDYLGSVRKITNIEGAVVNIYEYDSYGQFKTKIENIPNIFTYNGREFDSESGLYYYRARYYDPSTGRFIQEDPLYFAAGDLNVYRYVHNNPVNWNDPYGVAETFTVGRLNQQSSTRTKVTISPIVASFARLFANIASALNQGAIVAAETAADSGSGSGEGTGEEEETDSGTNSDAGTNAGAKTDAGAGSSAQDAQAPGVPTEADGYRPPKKWDGKKVKNPNGPGAGWPDASGDVWVPTGPGSGAHGGPHWDVQSPGGGYRNVYPGGRVR